MRLKSLSILGFTAAVVALNAPHPDSAAAWWWWPSHHNGGGAPEIGAEAISGALAIVGGGLALLRDRMRRR
jgi:hypothetical protein